MIKMEKPDLNRLWETFIKMSWEDMRPVLTGFISLMHLSFVNLYRGLVISATYSLSNVVPFNKCNIYFIRSNCTHKFF